MEEQLGKDIKGLCKGITKNGFSCKRKVTGQTFCKTHECKVFTKPDDCPVCFESMQDVNIPLSCGHWIHRKCIIEWATELCPLCKQKVALKSEEKFSMRIQALNRSLEKQSQLMGVDTSPILQELTATVLVSHPMSETLNRLMTVLRGGFMI